MAPAGKAREDFCGEGRRRVKQKRGSYLSVAGENEEAR